VRLIARIYQNARLAGVCILFIFLKQPNSTSAKEHQLPQHNYDQLVHGQGLILHLDLHLVQLRLRLELVKLVLALAVYSLLLGWLV
jgi:hypothetical protein